MRANRRVVVSLFTYHYINPDGSVFYQGGLGVHRGSYYGFSNGKTKKVKVYKKEDGYVPTIDDKGYYNTN